ncbi:MAG: hypothetical protein ABGZ35_23540, partial [Planctomycetaceae bacterium]
ADASIVAALSRAINSRGSFDCTIGHQVPVRRKAYSRPMNYQGTANYAASGPYPATKYRRIRVIVDIILREFREFADDDRVFR